MATIRKNLLYNILYQVLSVLFPIITVPYITRILDPEGVGIYNFVSSYTSYFTLFAVLGITNYGVREIAKIRGNLQACEKFISQMMSIELMSTILASVVFVASVLWIEKFSVNARLFIFAGIPLYLSPFKIDWFFKGREEFGYITLRSLIVKLSSLICLFIFVRTKEDLPSYILLSVFSSIANEVWNYTKLLRLGVRPRITFCGLAVHYKPIFTLFASTIAMSIYVMLDSLMLGLLSNYDEVAYYSVSMHLVKTFVSIATSLAAVAIPRMSQYNFEGEYDKMNLLVEKSLGIVSLMAFPFCIGIMLIAPVFAPLFFGESFMGAIGPMQIGALVIVAIGYSNLNGLQILVALGQDRPFFVSVLSGAIFNFMMNFILIPSYGAIGATISSVMAETLICIVTEYYVRKYTKVKISNYSNVIKSICGALLFIPMSNVCYKLFTGWTFIIIMVFSCAFIYCVFQLLTKNSIFQEFFQSMVHKHRGYAKIG